MATENELKEAYFDTLSAEEQDAAIVLDIIKTFEKKVKKLQEQTEQYIKDSKESLKQETTQVLQTNLQAQKKGLQEITQLVNEAKDDLREGEKRLQMKLDIRDGSRKQENDTTLKQFSDFRISTESKLASLDATLHDQKSTKEEIRKEIEDLKRDFNRRLSQREVRTIIEGGGNMNRQIRIDGDASILSRYTDINFQNSSSIGWVGTIDSTNRRVNITASIVAASGSGITRSVSVLSVSSTMAAAATTDYVFFPNVGIQLTLPTAISNSNLYTVKNMAASSVLVAAATGEDIDGSTTALMPTQYESLSFISNGSVWGVT